MPVDLKPTSLPPVFQGQLYIGNGAALPIDACTSWVRTIEVQTLVDELNQLKLNYKGLQKELLGPKIVSQLNVNEIFGTLAGRTMFPTIKKMIEQKHSVMLLKFDDSKMPFRAKLTPGIKYNGDHGIGETPELALHRLEMYLVRNMPK